MNKVYNSLQKNFIKNNKHTNTKFLKFYNFKVSKKRPDIVKNNTLPNDQSFNTCTKMNR